MKPKNSFIKWCVDQGHTVFVISWVNPGPELADKGFADYLLDGPMAAIEAIEQATGETEINAIGYCIGGTLMASSLAYMAATTMTRIAAPPYLLHFWIFPMSATFRFLLTSHSSNLQTNICIVWLS